MDYEKKYKDLVKAVKELQEANPSDKGIQNWVHENVSELREESEDEKVRRCIGMCLTDANEQRFKDFNTNLRDCLNWLEKQATPQVRTGLEWLNTIDDACDKRYAEEYAHGEYCHEQSFKWGFQEGVEWLEKQGEQETLCDKCRKEQPSLSCQDITELVRCAIEHEQKPKFKVGDKVIGIVSGLQYYITEVCNDYYNTESGCTITFCAQNNFKLIAQKPATWSEEDERILSLLLNTYKQAVEHRTSSLTQAEVLDIYSWLKSLKDRVQPKQEWSEEDDSIVEDVRNSFEFHCDEMTEALQEQYNKFFDKVKSLRPQKQWKPSDEQMNALKEACDKHWEPDGLDPLYTLYEQLKKLRE